MTRSVLYFLIFLFLALSSVHGGSKADSSNKKDEYYRGVRSYGDQQKRSNFQTNEKSVSAPSGKSSGGGLGAWGYMVIILTITGIGTGIYYFSLFYPILCKRTRTYDVMEISSV
ncbi:uncharacterized protein LOC110828630 [Zootermopsis nevadensis]|uniref:Transmembrane protein n=1 Tax=Zootermopsis nevadensis TaxID=136037 RepID=A0A067RD10_ZOONE|nr:uncharacterized protein LOC110828630 [Zootermopsis nevadensis]KDR20899.1 hypothetical protein L798_04763 [Zootermopsis nevadensis]